jgi:hypothetical protein
MLGKCSTTLATPRPPHFFFFVLRQGGLSHPSARVAGFHHLTQYLLFSLLWFNWAKGTEKAAQLKNAGLACSSIPSTAKQINKK